MRSKARKSRLDKSVVSLEKPVSFIIFLPMLFVFSFLSSFNVPFFLSLVSSLSFHHPFVPSSLHHFLPPLFLPSTFPSYILLLYSCSPLLLFPPSLPSAPISFLSFFLHYLLTFLLPHASFPASIILIFLFFHITFSSSSFTSSSSYLPIILSLLLPFMSSLSYFSTQQERPLPVSL